MAAQNGAGLTGLVSSSFFNPLAIPFLSLITGASQHDGAYYESE